MVTPQGPDVQYVPRQETTTTIQPGASVWLILLLGLAVPALIAYALAMNEPAFAIAMFCALLSVVLILSQPFWGVVVFLVLIYLRPEEMFPSLAGARLTLAITSLTLIGTWFHIFLKKEKFVKLPANWLMISFVAVAIGSTFQGGGTTGEAVRAMGINTALYFLLINLVRTPKYLEWFISTLIGVTVYLAGNALYLLEIGTAYNDKHYGISRVLTEGSIFNDPNDLASAIVPGIGLMIMRFVVSKGWKKAIYAPLVLLCIYSMLQTGSRGGMLAMLFVLVVSLVLYTRSKYIAVIVAFFGLAVFLKAGPSRMTEYDSQEDSAHHRIVFWYNGLEEFQARPLTGVGYGMYADINNQRPPHNTFMQVLTELGIFGIFTWIGMIYYSFRKRNKKLANVLYTNEQDHTLLGCRIALGGMLVAVFFLTRGYIPIHFIYTALPFMCITAFTGKPDIQQVDSKEWFKDAGIILGICIGITMLIKLIVWKNL